jgi:hypothetical protein
LPLPENATTYDSGKATTKIAYDAKDIIFYFWVFNPLNAKLNPICHLLALLGAHHILHVNSLRVKG